MNLSVLTSITFVSCVYAAAVALPGDLENEAIAAIQRRDLGPIEYPGGRRELEAHDGETYQGSIIVSSESKVQADDAHGSAIDPSKLDDEAAEGDHQGSSVDEAAEGDDAHGSAIDRSE